MAFKFEAVTNGVKITDTVKSEIIVDWAKKDMYYDTAELDADRVVIYKVTPSISDANKMIFRESLSDCTDSGDVVFTASTFRTFANENLGA